jgi:hypothetical protein
VRNSPCTLIDMDLMELDPLPPPRVGVSGWPAVDLAVREKYPDRGTHSQLTPARSNRTAKIPRPDWDRPPTTLPFTKENLAKLNQLTASTSRAPCRVKGSTCTSTSSRSSDPAENSLITRTCPVLRRVFVRKGALRQPRNWYLRDYTLNIVQRNRGFPDMGVDNQYRIVRARNDYSGDIAMSALALETFPNTGELDDEVGLARNLRAAFRAGCMLRARWG